MKVINVFLLVALLAVPFCVSEIYTCTGKSLFQDYGSYTLKVNDGDYDIAYNDVASCTTLKTEQDDGICCYLKLKIDNSLYDETFTQRGCYEVTLSNITELEDQDKDFDEIIDSLEDRINKANQKYNVTVDKISLDCSSKFIQFVGISLLLLLL